MGLTGDVGLSQGRERGARHKGSRCEASSLAKYSQPFGFIILVLGSYPKHVRLCKGTCTVMFASEVFGVGVRDR